VTLRLASLAPYLVAGLVALAAPGVAHAANNDEEALALVEGVFASDFVEGKHADALEKLQLAATVCAGGGCSSEATAKVYVAIGTVFAAGLDKPDDAREAFRLALEEDPKVQLLKGFQSDEVKEAFAAAGGAGGGKPAGAKSPSSDAIPERSCEGSGRAPRGWRSAGAYDCYQEALAAEDKREWLECAGWALGSTKAEERSTSRFLAGRCLERGGRWVAALAQYEKVADAGTAASKQGRERADALRGKIPKLVVRPPSKAQDLEVRLDGEPLEASQLGGEVWIDPGEHTVRATGTIGGEPVEFEQTLSVGEFETASVDVRLVPKEATISDSAIMKCMTAAKTREDFAKCIGEEPGGSELNFLFGSEVSGYADDDNVAVITPGAFGSVVNPTEGWSAGGAFLVDVVTAASSDIVATASPRWTEVRYVPSANGSYKIEDVTLSARANASIEPDYLALGGGVTGAVDLRGKTVTPSLSYDFGYDISGRAGTDFSAYSRKIHRHGIDGAVSLVLDKATVLTLGVTTVLEFGDTSKPYRYIPMFSPTIAEQIPAGLQADAVDFYREPERVLEQVPTDRQRYALGGRVAHRFASSTIRAEERLYVDSWGILASTTDARYVIDLDDRLRVWPHFRGHLQTGADFWQLAYVAQPTPSGVVVPAIRAGDRELGPMIGLTLGGGLRWALGEEKNWALTFSGDGVYTRFLDHLYILERLAAFGALSLEVEIE
jgi:hypothetical protein